jgi:quercetin dioxygenase-like cupin family protein
MKVAVVALLACFAFAAVNAQPFAFNGTFAPRVSEIAQRKDVNYTGFVFDFRTAKKTDMGGGNGSNLKSNQVGQNPFLSTLPGDGNGQTLVTLAPCSGNTVHTHPRGSEISFVTYGEMVFGMVEENTPEGNILVNRNIRAGETIHIPKGLQHFSHNPTCLGAQFLANFATADPGTQTTWNSFIQVPTAILQMSTGIAESEIAKLKQLPLVIAPGTGGEECLKRCGLDFNTVNRFEPSAAEAGNGR